MPWLWAHFFRSQEGCTCTFNTCSYFDKWIPIFFDTTTEINRCCHSFELYFVGLNHLGWKFLYLWQNTFVVFNLNLYLSQASSILYIQVCISSFVLASIRVSYTYLMLFRVLLLTIIFTSVSASLNNSLKYMLKNSSNKIQPCGINNSFVTMIDAGTYLQLYDSLYHQSQMYWEFECVYRDVLYQKPSQSLSILYVHCNLHLGNAESEPTHQTMPHACIR